MLIYSELFSPRLEFVSELLFRELLGIKTRITTDPELYQSSTEPRLNYSHRSQLPGLHIRPSKLLFENRIANQDPKWERLSNATATLHFGNEPFFDTLAASFYLVTRYEEYLPFQADAHNRFPAEASILFEGNELDNPVVNLWALSLLEQLRKLFPELKSEPRKFNYLSTIDVDQAWKYRNKGLHLRLGGIFKDLLSRDLGQLKERMSVWRGAPDPYSTFDLIDDIHSRYGTAMEYFVQVGHRGPFDKNQNPENPEFQALIRRLSENAPLGVHPSYRSNGNPNLLRDEKQTLERIAGKRVRNSRQHYLMHRMPHTFNHLIDNGIEADYTMGYSTHSGFRMGLAAPCKFFDLKKNQVTALRLIPFCLMDITPMHYMHLDPEKAREYVREQIRKVHAVGGLYCTLWHNESLGESGRWKGWSSLYSMIQETCSKLI